MLQDVVPNELFALACFVVTPYLCGLLTKHVKQHHLSRQDKLYLGSCHCKAVQYNFTGPRHLVVWKCNCSICHMKRNWHVIINQNNFQLQSDQSNLTDYRFNTKAAKHMFCKTCGVQSFYYPRSNPDGVGITFACIDPSQVESYEIKSFDGQNWETFLTKSGITKFSKQ